MDTTVTSTSGSQGRENTMDATVLEKVDINLFMALRKLDTPKTRVCSALWLSYAEYDELSRLI